MGDLLRDPWCDKELLRAGVTESYLGLGVMESY